MLKGECPLVSIVVLNYNGLKWLKPCLDSVVTQTYSNYEVILVDNGSVDTSVEFVEQNYPSVKVVRIGKNLGFAEGNNVGAKVAKGEFLFLLNNDTYVEKDYLEKLLKSFDEIPNLGCVQSKLVLM